MSSTFPLLVFLVFSGLLVGLALQDPLEPLSRKHAPVKPQESDKPLPANNTQVPQLRENPPLKGIKHPTNWNQPVYGDSKPSVEHEPKPHPRKTEPSSKNKVHAPAGKPSMQATPYPVGESRNHTKKNPLPKDGMRGCKKPSVVKRPAPGKKRQCHLRRL